MNSLQPSENWAARLGVRGGIRTHGPRIHPTSAFAAALSNSTFVGWTVPSPRPIGWADGPTGAARPVSTPSRAAGLARDWQASSDAELSPTLSGSVAPFPCATPNLTTRNPVLYPAELRGQPNAS